MRENPRRAQTAASLFVLVGIVNLVSACADDDGATSQTKPPVDNTPTETTIIAAQNDLVPLDHQPSFEPDYNNLTAQPWVEPVTDTQRDAVDVFPDRLVFPDSMTEVGDWEPGRVVASGPGAAAGKGKNPMGFARRVVKVEHIGSQFVVTTSVAAIEDILQGDFQLQLKPETMAEMDIDKADLQWVSDNLYFQSPEADLMVGELLVDDYPDGQDPLGFWSKVKKGFSSAGKAIGGAAQSVAKGAIDLYKKVTPASVSGSVKLAPNISITDSQKLFEMGYSKSFNTKGGLPFTVALTGSGDYAANLKMNPGVQVGAKIALPGHNAKSSYWVNVDASMALKLGLNFQMEASITSGGGESGSALQDKLDQGSSFAQDLLSSQREKLLGDPDMRPQGGWKKTLWISRPATQTFAAGPVPVVMVETVQIDLECGFQAKAGLQAKLELEQNATLKFSVKSNEKTAPPQFSKSKKIDVQVTGSGSVTVNCGLVPRVNVFFYDTVGLFAGVRGSLVATGSYESTCNQDPKEWRPTGELTLGLYGNVGVRAGARIQVPGSSWAGKAGQSLGVEADVEPWNTQFPLLEKKWTFPKGGIGYCLPRCKNLAKDGDETGVDCGGSCGSCAVGSGCKLNSDCGKSVCANGVCSTNHCADGVMDATETDVDCGGPKCAQCAVGKGCATGNDCQSTFCSTWTAEPPVCKANHCEDGIKDADESGVDCGGKTCPKCAAGAPASSPSDCASGAWNGTICVASACFDMLQSANETAVDCGGATCTQRCGFKQGCKLSADCAKGLACHPTQYVCLRAVGAQCKASAECVTNDCGAGVCMTGEANCGNQVQDGGETDVDCGGPGCSKCDGGMHCMVGSDCITGSCVVKPGSSYGHCTYQG